VHDGGAEAALRRDAVRGAKVAGDSPGHSLELFLLPLSRERSRFLRPSRHKPGRSEDREDDREGDGSSKPIATAALANSTRSIEPVSRIERDQACE
jgi:hypothetical protein